jgi:uncharacterized membrane protein
MKHYKRRISAGQMLMDVTKYLLTIGFIGGILTERLNIITGISIVIVSVILFVVAFFTIPPEREE